MNSPDRPVTQLPRRAFLRQSGRGIVALGASGLLAQPAWASLDGNDRRPHHAARARRVIQIVLEGGPSQLDLFEDKPWLREHHGEAVGADVVQARTLPTGSRKGGLRYAAPIAPFQQFGQCGMSLSSLLPRLGGVADQLCLLRAMHTDALDHPEARRSLLCGATEGSPALGAWIGAALGNEHRDLPPFITLGEARLPPAARVLPPSARAVHLSDRPSILRSPPGLDATTRGELDEAVRELDRLRFQSAADPDLRQRTLDLQRAQRLQEILPSLSDVSSEPAAVRKLYGPSAQSQGLAYHCLLARRLCEAGVRMVQIHHRGWDQHTDLATRLPHQAHELDGALSGLLQDLQQRGLLEDTLVVCIGEFGRSPWAQNRLEGPWGRDHHPVFAALLAGAGVRPGQSWGTTDERGLNITEGAIHIRDYQATLLHLLGLNAHRLRAQHAGRNVSPLPNAGKVVNALLS